MNVAKIRPSLTKLSGTVGGGRGEGERGRWGEGEMNIEPPASCLLPSAGDGERGR
ncbi:MAG: hypothetical protein F6K58_12240 [Symploca sp. SIO2E9]|nr:hypothetical protein [Symploca sp. SIO2E9]